MFLFSVFNLSGLLSPACLNLKGQELILYTVFPGTFRGLIITAAGRIFEFRTKPDRLRWKHRMPIAVLGVKE